MIGPSPRPFDGGPREGNIVVTHEFDNLLLVARQRGFVTQAEVIEALFGTELTTNVIQALIERVKGEGIEFIQDIPEQLVDDKEVESPLHVVESDEKNLQDLEDLEDGKTQATNSQKSNTRVESESSNATCRSPKRSVVDKSTDKSVKNTSKLARGLESKAGSKPLSKVKKKSAERREDFGIGDTADAVHAYLSEIGRVPLLTGSIEIETAKQIEEGLHAAARLLAHSLAQAEGEPALQILDASELDKERRLVKNGERAKRLLIESNLRLVVSIAKRYRHRGMAFLDLIQEGNLGLIRAVDKFDYSKGFRFSTYATWWIRQAITHAIADQSRTIRIPVHMVETINKIVWTQRQLAQELEREPTVEEISSRVDISVERIREIQRINQDTISLEQPVGEEDDFSLSDLIEDRSAVVPDDAAARSMLDQAVKEALSHLSEREQGVVRMRFGLDDGKIRTLEEVGKAFGVTRERVRQIESKTLAKLRRPDPTNFLRGYLEDEA